MNFTQLPKHIDISNNERRVLALLQKRGPSTVAEISRSLRIPRMTLYTPISSLLSRQLILSHKESKFNTLSLNLELLANIFNAPKSKSLGRLSAVDLVLDIANLPQHERVQWIQPNTALKQTIKNISLSSLANLNKVILKRGFIFEAILEDDSLGVYRSTVGDKKFKDMAKGLFGRPYDVSYIQPGILEPFIDIIITTDKVVFIDWKDEAGFVYTERSMINFYKRYFDLIKNISKRVDVNKMLTEAMN